MELGTIVLLTFTYLHTIKGVFGEGVFTQSCDVDQKSMTFEYVNDVNRSATYVFAAGKATTCSLTSTDPQVTGDGTSATPHTLTVQPVDSPSDVTACGIAVSGNVYSFNVEVRFGTVLAIIDAEDKTYTVSCDFTQTTAATRSTVVAQYACDGTKKLHFNYINAVTTPVDIYAVDKRATCGMAAGSGSGTGAADDRFELAIDLSGTQTPDCGAQEIGTNIYEVSIIVQSTALILKSDDIIYRLVCNFSQPFSELSSADGVTIDSQLTNGTATNLKGQARLDVTNTDGARVTQIRLGQEIKLQVDLVGSAAEGLRVLQCSAKPSRSSSKAVVLLGSDGCPEGNLNLMGSFSSTAGVQASTQPFKAFRFDDAASLVFICMVDFCYDIGKVGCEGSHCTTSRRKRNLNPAKQEEVSAVVVVVDSARFDNLSGANTNTSSAQPEVTSDCSRTLYWTVLSFILLIIGLLFVLIVVVVFLCLKLRRRSEGKKDSK